MKPLEIKKTGVKLIPLSEKKESKKEEKQESHGLQKSDFLFMEARGNVKKPMQCASCWKFTGKTCLEFSGDFPVKADATCCLYSQGEPSVDMLGKEKNATTPEIAGYVEETVTCQNCHYFYPEKDENDCLLFRLLGMKDYHVEKTDCCNGWSKKG